jgi:hypothetical protein
MNYRNAAVDYKIALQHENKKYEIFILGQGLRGCDAV